MLRFFHTHMFRLAMIFSIIVLIYATTTVSQGDQLPSPSPLIHHEGYTLAYDGSRRNPSWVYEHLTAESLKGATDRSHYTFKEDDRIPSHLRASLSDYQGYGFDRGHMAPAADHRSSPASMNDTFYLSNVCPQCPQFNRGYWAKFEKYVRDLTKEYSHVHVITGPLYLPTVEEGGKRYVKYEVIGANDVAVPTHFFKLLALDDSQGKREVVAYIMPNEHIEAKTPFDNFKTTVQKVERVSGLIYQFPSHNQAKFCCRY